MSGPPPEWEDVAASYARPSVQAGDPTGWFERFYTAGLSGEITMPWARREPHPLLVDWLDRHSAPSGRAVVVGCGLGADAEYLARCGYATTGFDGAPTAIGQCQVRYPESAVDYRVAHLFDLPAEWQRAFDLVVEISTVQALPTELHAAGIDALRSLVAPGGRLLVIARQADPDVPPSPPWPLTRAEIESFARDGLRAVAIETLPGASPGPLRWRAEFARAS
jgi:2-polyprenyl-3-methyl-5-hydroxy-6-metoxy-1,4-benzoquinol methylase